MGRRGDLMNFRIPLKQELLETEPWIIRECGFRIVHHSYSPKTMGTSDVELESDAFWLHLVRDPLTVYIEVASLAEPRNWCAMSLVLKPSREHPRCGRELHEVAAMFRENLAVLTRAMGPDWPETKRELERRYQLRMRENTIPHPVTWANRLRLIRMRMRRRLPIVGFVAVVAIAVWIISR